MGPEDEDGLRQTGEHDLLQAGRLFASGKGEIPPAQGSQPEVDHRPHPTIHQQKPPTQPQKPRLIHNWKILKMCHLIFVQIINVSHVKKKKKKKIFPPKKKKKKKKKS